MHRLTDVEAVQRALDLARTVSTPDDDVPVGAVVLDASGTVIGQAINEREASGDPTAHAEVLAIRRAASTLDTWRLDGCTIAVTMEPCPMCAGAIGLARIDLAVSLTAPRLWAVCWRLSAVTSSGNSSLATGSDPALM